MKSNDKKETDFESYTEVLIPFWGIWAFCEPAEHPRTMPHGSDVWDAKSGLPNHVPKNSICYCKDLCTFKGVCGMQNIYIRCREHLVKSWSHLSQTYIWVTRSWEGFVTVKSDVDRSDSFKINACMAVSHEQDKDTFPGGAEEKSSWFSAETGSNTMLRLPVYGSRVIYDHNGSFFRQRPKQKAPSEDLANFEVLRDA